VIPSTYAPTDSADSADSVHDTTATDTTTTQTTPDAPNLRPMTTAPKPLPPGVEKLPSGRFRAKLRDPTRENAWMPGGVPEGAVLDLLEAVEGLPLVTLARETRDAQGKTRARAALSLALEALEVCDRVSQSTEGAVSAVSAVSAGGKGL